MAVAGSTSPHQLREDKLCHQQNNNLNDNAVDRIIGTVWKKQKIGKLTVAAFSMQIASGKWWLWDPIPLVGWGLRGTETAWSKSIDACTTAITAHHETEDWEYTTLEVAMETAAAFEALDLGCRGIRADYPEFTEPAYDLGLHMDALLKLFSKEAPPTIHIRPTLLPKEKL